MCDQPSFPGALSYDIPPELAGALEGMQRLNDNDRLLLAHVHAQLGELLDLAARLRPLVELAAAFVPPGSPPDFVTAARVRKRVRAWLR